MALSEKTEYNIGGVEADGVVFVKKITTVLKDGQPFGSPIVHRAPLNPGDSVAGLGPVVAAVTAAVWTPDILEAWAIKQAQRAAAGP